MKKIIYLFIVFSITFVSCKKNNTNNPTNNSTVNSKNSQWSKLNSGDTTCWFTSVYFVSLNIGWVVGSGGTILKTTNGGNNWFPQNSHTTKNLNKVVFADENNGVIVGDFGVILRTSDGGITWHITIFGPSDIFNDPRMFLSLCFISPNIFIAGGGFSLTGGGMESLGEGEGVLIKRTINDTNWSFIGNNTGFFPRSIDFINANTGFACRGLEGGGIYKTTNGGMNWFSIENNGVLFSINFFDSDNGFIVGEDGLIYKTLDGGDFFTKPLLSSSYFYWDCTDAKLLTANIVFIVCSDGGIYRTTDGGASWVIQKSSTPNQFTLNAIFFIDSNTGFAVGSKGLILKTINASAN